MSDLARFANRRRRRRSGSQRLGKHAARRSRRDLDGQQRRERRRQIVERCLIRVLTGRDAASHQNQGDVRVVVVWRAVRGALRLTNPVGLENDLEVA